MAELKKVLTIKNGAHWDLKSIKTNKRHRDLPSNSNLDIINAINNLDDHRNGVDRIFAVALGFMAFIDFCAAMARRHHQHNISIDSTSPYEIVVHWLCEHSNVFGILFSFLWFMDSFLAAQRKSLEMARYYDKQKFLENLSSDDDVKSKTPWRGFRWIFLRTITMQMLLLPVGFFVFLYKCVLYLFKQTTVGDPHITISHHTSGDLFDETEIFSSTSSISLGFALLKHITITVAQRTNNLAQLQTMEKSKKLAYKLALRGLRHPFRFNKRIRFVLSVVRWIQYIGPLFGTANKLMDNVNNLILKMKQRRLAVIAATIRQKRCRCFTRQELQEYFATLIQKTFRSYITRRRLFFLRVLKGEKDTIAAIKLQDAFRRALLRSRANINEKLRMLLELKSQERESMNHPNKMSISERRRMYQLQVELESEAKLLINQRLLLRPNTVFAITWKIMFVVAVLFEISTLALQPILARHKDPTTGKQLDMEAIMDKKFIPIPVLNQTECIGKIPLNLKLSQPMDSLKQIKEAVLFRWKTYNPRPWYCEGYYPRLQAIYIYLADFAIHRFLVLVSIIMFFDVYVEFFTGVYDKNTGQLLPPPFFKRYIFPGFLFQLIVNPEMDTIAFILSKAVVGVVHHDPIRILRWTVALFYPLFLIVESNVKKLWVLYVRDQNRNSVQYLYRFLIFS
jgi:hypothetical protein